MKTSIKKLTLGLFFFSLISLTLLENHLAQTFAYIGLQTWYQNMISSLLPFMILSALLIHLDLTDIIVKPFTLILTPLFHISAECLYVILMGFSCGFPMGAKAAVSLYQKGKLTKPEAEFLLSFTNNLGPIYFLSLVAGNVYNPKSLPLSLFIMYGLPLLYGLFLRHTIYIHKIPIKKTFNTFPQYTQNIEFTRYTQSAKCTKPSPKSQFTQQTPTQPPSYSLPQIFTALDDSITASLVQIASLGGYMIFFNLLAIIPYLLFQNTPLIYGCLHALIEISGGLTIIEKIPLTYTLKFLLTHTLLSFSGLCCFAQTLNVIKTANLSGKKYMLHKLCLCSITILFIKLFI